jgi:flavin reductase (DIM6/NTAB) family NADH-FMN oxidoreductase RutF
MAVSEDDFRHALSRFPSGVSVVTTRGSDGRPHGITVSAFCSVSLVPPQVLICIEKITASHPAFNESGAYVVNVLHRSQVTLSERFAAPAEDKFSDIAFHPGIEGIPVLENALANIECRITKIYDGGDHTIFIGSVEKATYHNGEPLIYYRSEYRGLVN